MEQRELAGQTKILRACAVLSAAHLASALAQPFLGGMMLGGSEVDALAIHSWNGRLVFIVCGVAAIALALAWKSKLAPLRVPCLALALLAAEGWQIHLGFTGNLYWHIPLGSIIVAGAAIMAYEAMRLPAETKPNRV